MTRAAKATVSTACVYLFKRQNDMHVFAIRQINIYCIILVFCLSSRRKCWTCPCPELLFLRQYFSATDTLVLLDLRAVHTSAGTYFAGSPFRMLAFLPNIQSLFFEPPSLMPHPPVLMTVRVRYHQATREGMVRASTKSALHHSSS